MSNYDREVRAMQAEPVETRNLYGQRILCGETGARFDRIRDHLREHHGIIALSAECECDAVNDAIGEASSDRSFEHICGGSPDAIACWPRAAETIGEIVLYTETEWNRAISAAEVMAETMPDDEA